MTGRDRLRELLDAVLDDDHPTLGAMASGAWSSPEHLARQVSRRAGEPPVTLRRRVLLERAAWRLRNGASVTDVALESGYDSVEGFSRAFSRAFGHAPSERPATSRPWLPAPNGIHFHPPESLWVAAGHEASHAVFAQLVEHDLDDTRHLLELAKGLDPQAQRREVLPGTVVLDWDGAEPSLAHVLSHQVHAKEVWGAAILGEEQPAGPVDDAATLLSRHDAIAPRWLALVRDLDQRHAWGDRLVDALCDPPESFVLSSVMSHVITYAAHRRQLARLALRLLGHPVDDGDPILWWQARLHDPSGDPR